MVLRNLRRFTEFEIFDEKCYDKNHEKGDCTLVREFLEARLKLSLHPDKVFIKTLAAGVDFLGWVHFSDHRVLRTATKRRMFHRLRGDPKKEVIPSYMGMLSHGNAQKLKICIQNLTAGSGA